MPTEPLAALVYVFLLVPGIAYAHQVEKHRPVGNRSAFRDTATVVVASSVCAVTVIVAALVTSIFSEPVANWIGKFIGNPAALVAEAPRGTIGLFIGALVIATAIGAGAGAFLTSSPAAWLQKNSKAIRYHVSGWENAFARHPKSRVMVSVRLKSGNWVYGQLDFYSPSPTEDGNRSITLAGSLWFRGAEKQEAEPLENAQIVVIQASEIDYLTVEYDLVEEQTAPQGDDQVATGELAPSTAGDSADQVGMSG